MGLRNEDVVEITSGVRAGEQVSDQGRGVVLRDLEGLPYKEIADLLYPRGNGEIPGQLREAAVKGKAPL